MTSISEKLEFPIFGSLVQSHAVGFRILGIRKGPEGPCEWVRILKSLLYDNNYRAGTVTGVW